ncbi:MAG: hypothetical protein GY841_04920 [FCB group bacterium]|nr:hypothetical protein [FCB group bacterium]
MNSAARNNISAISECAWVQEFFCWINKELSSLKHTDARNMVARMVGKKEGVFQEALAEIVFMALWKKLGWDFNKDPKVQGHRPDFQLTIGNNNQSSMIAEISIIRQNHDHYSKFVDGDWKMRVNGKIVDKWPIVKPTDQAHRVIMKVDQKYKKYFSLLGGQPLVVGLYQSGFRNKFYLDNSQFQSALYGDLKINFGTGETWRQPAIQVSESGNELQRGLFGFEEEYKNIVAVIVCSEEFYKCDNHNDKAIIDSEWRKAKFWFTIYLNPLCESTDGIKFFLDQHEILVSGIEKDGCLVFHEPAGIEFY